jgi:hypothetical protein
MSALTTHTLGNQRKGKRKEMNKKETRTSDRKPRKAKKKSLEEDKSRTP